METMSGRIVDIIQRTTITISNEQTSESKSEAATITTIETATVKNKESRKTKMVMNKAGHQSRTEGQGQPITMTKNCYVSLTKWNIKRRKK
jgi:hypothetical protein